MNKILAIDDEKDFTSMIQGYFEPRGYEVFIASDGDIGLAMARRERPEIALIDLKMPGLHGDDVLREMKSISPETKCFMITASEGEGRIRDRLMEIGAVACFDKPLSSLKDLEAVIKEALNHR